MNKYMYMYTIIGKENIVLYIFYCMNNKQRDTYDAYVMKNCLDIGFLMPVLRNKIHPTFQALTINIKAGN